MKRLIILLTFLHCAQVKAQNKSPIDSLLVCLAQSQEDTNKVQVLNWLAWEYSVVDGKKALSYSEQAWELAASLDYERGILTSRVRRAAALYILGNFRESEKSYLELLDIYRQKEKHLPMANMYMGLSAVYDKLGEPDKVMACLVEAARVIEPYKDDNMKLRVYFNIASSYSIRNNHKKAIEYYHKAAGFTSKNDHEFKGHIYVGLAQAYNSDKKSGEAWAYFMKAKNEYTTAGFANGLAYLYQNMGAYFISLKEFKKAREYNKKALDQFAVTGMPSEIADCVLNLSSSYLEDHKNAAHVKSYLDSSSYFIDSALRISHRFGLKNIEMEAYRIQSEIYAGSGKFDSSLFSLRHYMRLHDSVMSVEKEVRINELNTKYEVEKKENENLALLNENVKQKYTLAGIGFMVIAIGAAGWFLFRQSRLRSRQKILQMEQKLLRSQMNPHFMFNSLQSIQNFIIQNRGKDAVKYLSSFASLSRSVLENSRLEHITLKNELNLLENYMQLQKLRFGERFNYLVHLDETVDAENVLIPPMLSQPFIENALEHGLKEVEQGGLIEISIACRNEFLLLEIKDNGNGISNPEQRGGHRSLATAITRERIELLNRKQKRKTTFTITEAYPDATRKGVSVRFSIPLEN